MLATIAQVKIFLGITDSNSDSVLTQLLGQSDAYIKKYVDRELEATDYEDFLINGTGTSELLLRQFPVNEITKIEHKSGVNSAPIWTEYSVDDYNLDPNTGTLYFYSYVPYGIQNIRVNYNAGFETIPLPLNLSCIKLVAYYYNTRQSDGIMSESVDGANITYHRNDTQKPDIPMEISVILDEYKTYYV